MVGKTCSMQGRHGGRSRDWLVTPHIVFIIIYHFIYVYLEYWPPSPLSPPTSLPPHKSLACIHVHSFYFVAQKDESRPLVRLSLGLSVGGLSRGGNITKDWFLLQNLLKVSSWVAEDGASWVSPPFSDWLLCLDWSCVVAVQADSAEVS